MSALFSSRKFLILLLDLLLSTITYFVTQYVSPETGNNVLWLIAAWQPLFVMVIDGITKEDSAEKSNPKYFDALLAEANLAMLEDQEEKCKCEDTGASDKDLEVKGR